MSRRGASRGRATSASERDGSRAPGTSGRGGAKARNAVTGLMATVREFSAAAVILHHTVAQRFGLSVTDLKALDILQRLGPLTAGEIAEHTRLATASVTSLLDRLERARLVRRIRDAADRRRVTAVLTRDFERQIAPLFRPLERRMLSHLKAYDVGQTELLRSFLFRAAEDMRHEAEKLCS